MKNYVRVLALYNEEGDIRPVKMEWEEQWLDVDRVLDIRPAASLRSGGAGLRYTCSIAGVPTYLFLSSTKKSLCISSSAWPPQV